jgi:hypothetical protein
MKKSALSKKLHALEPQAARFRERSKASKAGEIIYRAPQNGGCDNEIIVEADGAGRAKLLTVEGNYPIDYLVHSEKSFSSERDACDAADDILEE